MNAKGCIVSEETRVGLGLVWEDKMTTGIKLTSALALVLTGTAAGAVDPVTFKLAGFTPEKHFVSENTDAFFMRRVQELSDGAISFEYYPGQQLGKANAIMDLTLAGVTDIGQIALSYVGDKLPVASGVMELPGMNSGSCEGTAAFEAASSDGEVLYRTEFAENGLYPLFSIVLPPANVFTTDKQLAGPEDFKGLKLRVEGGVKARTADALGAVPVVMSSPDTYQALSRGTIDALMFNYASVRPYKIETVAKYGTKDFGFGATTVTYGLSQDRWSGLPDDVKAILSQAAAETIRNFCQYVDGSDVTEIGELEEAGMDISAFGDDAKADLLERLATVRSTWAQELDAKGRAGTEAFEKVSAALESYDADAWLARTE